MSKRPLIGVTGPERGGFMAWVMTAIAILRSGGRPRRITASRPPDLEALRGVVIGGGTDVDPLHYDQPRRTENDKPEAANTVLDMSIGVVLTILRTLFARHSKQPYDPRRDALEQRVIGYAIAFDLPVLGICRGAQLMNVALGGSLHQDIAHFYSEGSANLRSVLPCKQVAISPDTELGCILATSAARVNALHRQSIDTLGNDLRVSAQEASGVVQAIEKRGHRFFIGVQWHPEYIPQSGRQQGLFRALVNNATAPPPVDGN